METPSIRVLPCWGILKYNKFKFKPPQILFSQSPLIENLLKKCIIQLLQLLPTGKKKPDQKKTGQEEEMDELQAKKKNERK